jgi:hypothetical protein
MKSVFILRRSIVFAEKLINFTKIDIGMRCNHRIRKIV